jgi:transposase-like protein
VVQTCIVHLLRAALRYVATDEKKVVVRALRAVYTAADETAASVALDVFEAEFGKKYPTIGKTWRERWPQIVPFLAYPPEVRKMIYTTNPIESLNYQLRRVLKTKGLFPSDNAVTKLLYLAIRNAKKNWKPNKNWRMALSHFAIMFEDRMPA